jgi:predicted metal-binding protein
VRPRRAGCPEASVAGDEPIESVPPVTPTAPTLDICNRCRPQGWEGPLEERPGRQLALAVDAELAKRGLGDVARRDIYCQSQCKRACTVAFAGGAQRFTFLFGDLDPALHAGDVIDGFLMYRDRQDGFLARAERPGPLREGILARIAPPGWVGELVLERK